MHSRQLLATACAGLLTIAACAPEDPASKANAEQPHSPAQSSHPPTSPATEVTPSDAVAEVTVTPTAVAPPEAPESSGSPTAASAPPSKRNEQNFEAEGTATFDNFTVTIPETFPDLEAPVEGVVNFYVKVCLDKAIEDGKPAEVTVDSWTFRGGRENEGNVAESSALTEANPYQPAFPNRAELNEGECQEGFVAFDIGEHDDLGIMTLEYWNQLGDFASWKFQ